MFNQKFQDKKDYCGSILKFILRLVNIVSDQTELHQAMLLTTFKKQNLNQMWVNEQSWIFN